MQISKTMKALLGCAVLGAGCTSILQQDNAPTEFTGWIGAHQLTLRGQTIRTAATFPIDAMQLDYIAITELYPDATEPTPFHYLVTGAGIATFERHYFARGFGPVTYFLRVTRPQIRQVTLTNLGGTQHAPCILGVRAVTHDELAAVRRSDQFTLMGMAVNPHAGMSEEEQVQRMAQQLPVDPQRNIAHGFSMEIYYANRDAKSVRQQLEDARRRAQQYKMPVLLGLVSWWAGTPRFIPDGLGGMFGDVRYQQICYTPHDAHPEDPELKQLLGARYNPHYCRTTPNQWSDTPWLTMNSSQLNAYRAQRVQEAVSVIKEISQGDTSWIAGIFAENEPRYWDTCATEGSKYHVRERWADFNPCVVEAAARDGITLDPADGLSEAELRWLQGNVGRYNEAAVQVIRQALVTNGLADRFPLYAHSLQLPILFPGNKINQTAADWARVIGAQTGIEGGWSQPSDYDRVREWGPWCNLNREQFDGRPDATQLWDLRVTYATGSKCYNSYNWHAVRVKSDAYFQSTRALLADLPVVSRPPARTQANTPTALDLTPPGDLQAFTSLALGVERTAANARTVALAINDGPNRTWFSARQSLPVTQRNVLTFEFPVPAEVNWRATAKLRLLTYDTRGNEVLGAASFAPEAALQLRLAYDLAQHRALSRLVIQWQQAALR